jgi:hypothetical protein
MLLPLNYKTLQSRKADEVRYRAAEAVWLRYAPQRPPPLIIIPTLVGKLHDPRLPPLRYDSPLRTAGYREASTSPCRAEIGFSPDSPPCSAFR